MIRHITLTWMIGLKNIKYIIEGNFTQNTDKMSVWGPLSPKYRQLSASGIKGKAQLLYLYYTQTTTQNDEMT